MHQHHLLLPTLFAALALGACEPEQGVTPLARPAFALTGFVTAQGPQARLVNGIAGDLIPIATVGDTMPGSAELLAPIPDGIGAYRGGGAAFNVMMNHELEGVATTSGGTAFPFARVSRFSIDPRTLQIVDHSYVVNGTEGYQRLCSAAWVDALEGFPGGYFFTGEEVADGLQLAIDRKGRLFELPWVGLYNHENQISIPGFPGHVVVLNFDDNGGSGTGILASKSELYMYVGRDANDVLRGTGQLYVFASNGVEHPGQLTAGQSITGHWIAVPDTSARNAAKLEQFVDANGAFPFVRVEDGFYDKRPGSEPAVYFYDTGRQNIKDASGNPWDPWGSIYRLAFNDVHDPTGGTATLTLLARSTGPANGWASPDNGDMNSAGVLMLQEDPANSPWNRRPAIFRFQVAANGSLVDPHGTKVVETQEPTDPGNEAIVTGWETSGIVDASEWFGPNTWLFDVQAHGKPVANLGLTGENGQLLFLRLR
jgi:hypothetical protein